MKPGKSRTRIYSLGNYKDLQEYFIFSKTSKLNAFLEYRFSSKILHIPRYRPIFRQIHSTKELPSAKSTITRSKRPDPSVKRQLMVIFPDISRKVRSSRIERW